MERPPPPYELEVDLVDGEESPEDWRFDVDGDCRLDMLLDMEGVCRFEVEGLFDIELDGRVDAEGLFDGDCLFDTDSFRRFAPAPSP